MKERDWNPWFPLLEEYIKKSMDMPNTKVVKLDDLEALNEAYYKRRGLSALGDLFSDLYGPKGGSNQS
jgi:hypothetical protein